MAEARRQGSHGAHRGTRDPDRKTPTETDAAIATLDVRKEGCTVLAGTHTVRAYSKTPELPTTGRRYRARTTVRMVEHNSASTRYRMHRGGTVGTRESSAAVPTHNTRRTTRDSSRIACGGSSGGSLAKTVVRWVLHELAQRFAQSPTLCRPLQGSMHEQLVSMRSLRPPQR